MAYNANIPQPPDLLSNSQDEMLQNFIALKAAVDINHGTFGDPDEGMHKFVTIPTNVVPVNPVPVANDLVVKVRTSSLTNLPELVYQRTGSTRQFPVTVKQNNLNVDFVPGWATLGGNNLIIKWGSGSSSGFDFIEYPRGDGIPLFSAAPFVVQVSTFGPAGFNTNINAQLVSTASPDFFTISCTQRTTATATLVPFFWMAIGPT